MYIDLLPLNIDHFDVILGMDWLTKYHATIDCVTKQVVFRPPGLPEFVFNGVGVVPPPYLISSVKAVKLIRKGCKGYLCSVLTVFTDDNANVNSIPIVREFPDVFPDNLPGDLTDREIEFTVDVIPGTQPVSKAPYRMAPTELKELKVQL